VTEKRPTLVLFARAPVAGEVKTRLAGALGVEGAASLYRAFLEDAARIYATGPWSPVLYAESDPHHPDLASLFPPPWRREAQAVADLGGRLIAAFRAEQFRVAPLVAAVGSDHPALALSALAELVGAVDRGAEVALIPARDGGYCAIALSSRIDPQVIFDEVPWSSPHTLDRTLARIRARRLSLTLLEPSYDVDRPEDLELLRRDLARRSSAEPDYPHSTAAVLAGLVRAPA
jgi:uncharacterized protein